MIIRNRFSSNRFRYAYACVRTHTNRKRIKFFEFLRLKDNVVETGEAEDLFSPRTGLFFVTFLLY